MVRSASFVLFFISFTPFRWICSCPHYSTRLRKCTLHPHFSPLPSNSTALPRKNSDSTGGRVQKRLTNVHSWRTIYGIRHAMPYKPWLRSRRSSVPARSGNCRVEKGIFAEGVSFAKRMPPGPGTEYVRDCHRAMRWSADQGRGLLCPRVRMTWGFLY